MSARTTAWAWEQPLTGNEKLVLLALADWARDDGLCWPGHKSIAEKAGTSERTVGTVMGKLEAAGYLTREHRGGSGGGRKPDLTRLAVPAQATGKVTQKQPADSRSPRAGVELGSSTGSKSKNPPISPRTKTEFEDWLAHHSEVTGHAPPRAGTKARTALMEHFAARRREGWSPEDLRRATAGAHGDDYRRENGYDVPESVLRPTKVAGLVAKGKLREAPGADEIDWDAVRADQARTMARSAALNGAAA